MTKCDPEYLYRPTKGVGGRKEINYKMYPWGKFKRLSGCPHDGLIALVDMHRCEKIWEEIVGWVQGGRIPSTYLPWYFEIKSW